MKLQHLRDAHGDAIIHKAGCAHIKRIAQHEDIHSPWLFDAETKQEAANEVWSDFIAEESMDENDAFFNTKFAPCVTIK